jgi:hypothetical protein
MTRDELVKEIFSVPIPKEWRKGQFVFNRVDKLYGVARSVQFVDHVDCFHNDEAIDDFIIHALVRINNDQRRIN